MTTNNNGHAKKLHLYATALAAIVAVTLSVLSFVREVRDDRARQQTGEGLNAQQEVIGGLRQSVEFNRQLLLQLYLANSAAERDNRLRGGGPEAGGSYRPPSAPRQPSPAPPRLTPPDELFKNVPQIPRQEKRDWKNYEQRQVR